MELVSNVLFIYCLPSRDCANLLGLPTSTDILKPPSHRIHLIRNDAKKKKKEKRGGGGGEGNPNKTKSKQNTQKKYQPQDPIESQAPYPHHH
jgi:hypothetical protein